MEEEDFKQPLGYRPIMPCRTNHGFLTELENHICGLFVREGVPCAHVRDIKCDPHLSNIWCTLPCDMITLMWQGVWFLDAHPKLMGLCSVHGIPSWWGSRLFPSWFSTSSCFKSVINIPSMTITYITKCTIH